ncbi:MAG: peptide ABC transporter substrate-binding protein [Lachnospiraceae bacterium]|nr:peptide ABC transporter substrate-binding protein [Lachnospiraceae bacterium]
MRKFSKRVLSVALSTAMAFSLVACGSKDDSNKDSGNGTENTGNTGSESTGGNTGSENTGNTGSESTGGNTGSETAELSYDEQSKKIYDAVLGEFYDAYMVAKEADNVSERYALMAVAEAKLLESGVMLPLTSRGGNYTISRLAPNTVDYTLWGNDNERIHQAIVTTELISTEHRDEMKAKWNEVKGTGTYEQWVKDYLVEKGYTLKDSYTTTYTSDPETWDVLATSLAADSEMIVQTYDGLLEYDMEGVLQPALAESYSVSEDGLVYTFNLRKGVKWVDSQGREVAEVKADDFVAGMQHMMDAMGGLEYLVQGVIVNASEYIDGEVTDFSQVGVKAVDDYTLQYTLVAPTSYFDTMLGYGVFAPMSRSYYESQGGKFGVEYDSAATTYTYGKTPENIAYCGPFLVTNATALNTIVFSANESYWNADNINVKKYTVLYNDGSEATKAYNDAIAGTTDGAGLNASALELAKQDGNFEKYAYVASCDATSFMAFYNLNRAAFANFNDATKVVSTQTEEIAARTKAAMNNVHFRRAISFAVDRGAYNAQSVGEELKLTSLRNSYIPGTFIQLAEDVTIDINGTATTFAAGTWYGAIVQAQIDADGVAIKAFDPTADGGIGSSDAYDGWYNADEAVAELNKAIEELAAAGVAIDESNPIYIDVPYPANSESYTNRVNAYKQSLENVLGKKVIVTPVACADYTEWYYAGYYPSYGYEGNYDMSDVSGWGPDYGDPATYLDTMLPDYAGYMMKAMGIY